MAGIGHFAPKAQAADGSLLFNGKDLSGWTAEDSCWSVSNGVIQGNSGNRFRSFLRLADTIVDNFEMSFSFRAVEGRGGVAYRAQWSSDRLLGYAYDFSGSTERSTRSVPLAQILYFAPTGSGFIGRPGERAGTDPASDRIVSLGKLPKATPAVAGTNWHRGTIRAQGGRIVHTVDGVVASEAEDLRTGKENPPRKAHASGGLFLRLVGTNSVVQFKDISLKKL